MENSPKKPIESFKDQEVDGQNVKGGFTFIRHDNGVAYYNVLNRDFKNAAMQEAKQKGFTSIVFTLPNQTTHQENIF